MNLSKIAGVLLIRSTFDVLVFSYGLKQRVPPGGGYGGQGNLLFVVGAFGG